MSKKPVLLCIMDGFGWVPNETYGNAVVAAKTPHLDALMAKYPMTTIEASGMAVGLPDGQMGNSEVGHTNMGAGRIVYQQLTLITKSIRDGEMFKNPVLVKNMKAAIEAGKAIHLMGLVGTGGVHSHADHWFGVLEMAKHMGAKEVYLHCITDGRDTDPHAGKGFLADLQAKLDELGVGKIASVSGRYYAMDRDNNWDREEKAYAAFVYGEGNHAANAAEAIEASYAADKTDEFVLPCVTCEGGRVQDGDTVIFMNFRPDRARQMTRIFCDDDFKGFERRGGRKQVNYVCMAEYDATMPNVTVAFPHEKLKNIFGEYLSQLGLTPLRIAETEKYAHVTFFLNGGREETFEGEERILVPSPKVATYDLQPEMSAYEVKDMMAAVTPQTKLAAVTHVSNVTGRLDPIEAVIGLVHEQGGVVLVDAAQSAPHMPIDVQELDADFLAFSGHKLMAPMGIGALYGKKALLEDMPPFLSGGEMIDSVSRFDAVYAPLPHKFEAGTVNGGGAVALQAAIEYMKGIGWREINRQEELLTEMAMGEMKRIPGVHLIGSTDPKKHHGIISFTIDDVHPHDIASILDADKIAVRAGHHCAQPLLQHLGVMSTARASIAFYNTEEDIERFIKSVKEIRRRMGYGE